MTDDERSGAGGRLMICLPCHHDNHEFCLEPWADHECDCPCKGAQAAVPAGVKEALMVFEHETFGPDDGPRGHHCLLPADAPPGVLWRCACGQLWQLSIAANGWVRVDPLAELALENLGLLPGDE